MCFIAVSIRFSVSQLTEKNKYHKNVKVSLLPFTCNDLRCSCLTVLRGVSLRRWLRSRLVNENIKLIEQKANWHNNPLISQLIRIKIRLISGFIVLLCLLVLFSIITGGKVGGAKKQSIECQTWTVKSYCQKLKWIQNHENNIICVISS